MVLAGPSLQISPFYVIGLQVSDNRIKINSFQIEIYNSFHVDTEVHVWIWRAFLCLVKLYLATSVSLLFSPHHPLPTKGNFRRLGGTSLTRVYRWFCWVSLVFLLFPPHRPMSTKGLFSCIRCYTRWEVFRAFYNKIILVRQREKPTRYKVAAAILALEEYGLQNCESDHFNKFKTKFDKFMDNFTSFQISG